MFLNKLTQEEKEMFISLALKAAEANDVVENDELKLMEEYCKEMEVSFLKTKKVNAIDEIIGAYTGSTEEHKRIVLMEIIGLMYADGNYDKKEDTFVEMLAEKLNISSEVVARLKDLIIDYQSVSKEILDCLTGK